MKIALCLSGQPRKALESYQFIKTNIIDANRNSGDQVDVFIHMNYNSENTYIEKSHLDNGICHLPLGIDQLLLKLYQPKKYEIEKPHSFNNPNLKVAPKRLQNLHMMNKNKNFSNQEQRDHIFKQLLSMYYSIYKCNQIKEIYANDHHFVYDYVIRLRYDAVPLRPLICNKYDPNFIYYQDMNHSDQIISDWLNFGSNSIMNIYSSIFLHIEYINSFRFYKKEDRKENTLEPSDECSGLSEHMVRDIMDLFKIPKKSFDINLKLI